METGSRLLVSLALIYLSISLTLGNGEGSYNRYQAAKSQGQPWPMPQSYKPTPTVLSVDQFRFTFVVLGETCDILQDAIDRYTRIIFRMPQDANLRFQQQRGHHRPTMTDGQLHTMSVKVAKACDMYPSLGMDESYNLDVMNGAGMLISNTVWGALRGLETFSQLVYEAGDGQFVANATMVHDFPRFSWRGVLMDTSRHFLPKHVIKQNLEAMAYNKMNVFHWHIVDDNSFPYQSRDFPDLSNKGAYDPYTHVYSQEDIKDIVEFARLRGIRVVPEFDTPGHSHSWGLGQPGLLTPCYAKGKPDGTFGPINPAVNSTFTFLKGLMKELTQVFPDKYLHLGGDEVSFACWMTNPGVIKFMKQMSFGKDFFKLEQFYMQSLLDIVSSYNSGYIIWQEVIDNGCKVRPDTVVHVWKGGQETELSKVTSMGYQAILSSCWYLNYISYAKDWPKYYTCDPLKFNGTAEQKKLVIGGELAMWGEYVDATNSVSRTWPRGSAVAERLWSPQSLVSAAAATPRIEEHRCRLIRRGLNVEPINGPGFCRYEY